MMFMYFLKNASLSESTAYLILYSWQVLNLHHFTNYRTILYPLYCHFLLYLILAIIRSPQPVCLKALYSKFLFFKMSFKARQREE